VIWPFRRKMTTDEHVSEPPAAPPSQYRVERLGGEGTGITRTYRYRIWRGSDQVADFVHDFRGDENWFEIGSVTHDYNGGDLAVTWERGGPVNLTADGEARLDRLLARVR
jgi:hypothetical protein